MDSSCACRFLELSGRQFNTAKSFHNCPLTLFLEAKNLELNLLSSLMTASASSCKRLYLLVKLHREAPTMKEDLLQKYKIILSSHNKYDVDKYFQGEHFVIQRRPPYDVESKFSLKDSSSTIYTSNISYKHRSSLRRVPGSHSRWMLHLERVINAKSLKKIGV